MRVFIFAFQSCYGETGGGQGVVYRLYKANKQYGIFEDVHFVFGDRMVDNIDPIGELAMKTRDSSDEGGIIGLLKAHCPGLLLVIGKKMKEKSYGKYLKQVSEKYKFAENDIYIFHDMQFCGAFMDLFPYSQIVFVNHSQGSVYNEWSAKRGRSSAIVRRYYNNQFNKIARRARLLGFPSKGAYDSLVESEPEFKKTIAKDKIRILYNGVDCGILDDYDIENTELRKAIEKKASVKLCTVAMLNEAKAVERIPAFLASLKANGVDFLWILVGNGINAAKVEKAIIDYKLMDRVIWVKEYVKHNDVLKVLSCTDFYILFHRYSIFDLSTLEAMHYGNIPVLSPVGGNLEVIIDENGLLITDTHDASALSELINCGADRINKMKKDNILLQKKMFDEKVFAERYKALTDEM